MEDPASKVKPLKILERRIVKRGNQVVAQVLIQWKYNSLEEATWDLGRGIAVMKKGCKVREKGTRAGVGEN